MICCGELTHSGILGMKWGVRRYQYDDGTLTPEGKIRYTVDNRRTLTDAELNDAITRIKKEIELKKVYDELNHPWVAAVRKGLVGAVEAQTKGAIASLVKMAKDAYRTSHNAKETTTDASKTNEKK